MAGRGRWPGERALSPGAPEGSARGPPPARPRPAPPGGSTALGLARLGAHVAITGRDPVRTRDAVGQIRAAGGGRVDAFVADLSSRSQVRRLAGEVLGSLTRIDALVNNVGGYWNTRHLTAD